MPAIVRPEDDVPIARQVIDVGDVPLGGTVLPGRDVAVIEDDYRPPGRRPLTQGDRQQRVDLQPLRAVGSDIPVVIGAPRQLFFDEDLAARVVALTHRLNRERIQRRGRRQSLGGRRRGRAREGCGAGGGGWSGGRRGRWSTPGAWCSQESG